MTDRSPDVDAPRPDEVRRSLRALADGSASPRPADGPASPRPADGPTPPEVGSADPEAVVRDAERAADAAREAASFLSAGRLPGLDRAVATAARRDEGDIAARGRAARESLRRLDAALGGSGAPDPPADASDDHFHSGRGTVLGATAQGPDR